MNKPLVSIIIPMYNTRNYVVDSIESALKQNYKDVEIIVIDDGSTDGGHEVVEAFGDSRLHLHRTENRGLPAARNLGVARSQGKFISFLDSDDLLTRHSISSRQAALEEFGVNIAFSRYFFIRKTENKGSYDSLSVKIHKQEPKQWHTRTLLGMFLRDKFHVFSQALFMRREVFFEIGGFDESCRIHEDVEFLSRVLQLNQNVVETFESFYVERRREGSLRGINSPKKAADALHALNLVRRNLASWFNKDPDFLGQKIFSRCVQAYPHWTEEHYRALREAQRLMNGHSFNLACVGGPKAQIIARIFGWRAGRIATRMSNHARSAFRRYVWLPGAGWFSRRSN